MGANESIGKVSTDLSTTTQLGLSKLAGSVDTFTQGVENVGVTGIKSTENVLSTGVKSLETGWIDTERSITKGAVNIVGDFAHSGRFVAKNVVALADNTQDNIVQVVQDIRTDVTSTVQLTVFVVGVGAVAFFILYGDKIMERGINMSGLEIL